MGAGKGKTKRTQTLAGTPIRSLVASKQVWNDFVHDQELEDVKLTEYYLGGGVATLDVGDYEKIITELFADMVAVGAIDLPDDYTPDDFQFQTVQTESTISLRVRTKKPPLMKIDGVVVGDYFAAPYTFSNGRIMEGMKLIALMLRVKN